MPPTPTAHAPAAEAAAELQSLYEMILAGGPLMVPIGLCSVVALAYLVERSVRLAGGALGGRRLARSIVAAAREGGAGAALARARASRTPLARVLEARLERDGRPFLECERASEDAGKRELRRLVSGLRPLVVVAMIAPLLGLLGTVWGMIGAFGQIALHEGLGRPELLAGGIRQALVTTAAGLAVAIPAQAAYYYFRGRIERFVRRVEDAHGELERALAATTLAQGGAAGAASRGGAA